MEKDPYESHTHMYACAHAHAHVRTVIVSAIAICFASCLFIEQVSLPNQIVLSHHHFPWYHSPRTNTRKDAKNWVWKLVFQKYNTQPIFMCFVCFPTIREDKINFEIRFHSGRERRKPFQQLHGIGFFYHIINWSAIHFSVFIPNFATCNRSSSSTLFMGAKPSHS